MTSDRREIALRDPRTGLTEERIVVPSSVEVAQIAERLRAGQKAWAALGLPDRIAAMLRLRQAISDRADAISDALMRDTGRRRIAKGEVAGVVASIDAWSKSVPGLLPSGWTQGRSNPAIKHAPQWQPYSLAGIISPWNFPLLLTMIDATPALFAGCAVLAKPSDVTPRFAAPLNEAIAAAGMSDVFAIVPGDGPVGQAVTDVSDIVCFTGSVATGRKVAVQAAGRLIPVCLELGGKDPLIVLPSADIELAVTAALRGSVLSSGQACQSIERIYVHRSMYQEFLTRLTIAAKAARLNWPDIGSGEIGPIIFAHQSDILRDQIADAIAKGARLLCGGTVENHGGLWLRPTVLADVTHDMAVMTEETFGPIMPVAPYDTVDEAIALANDGIFGLSAAVFAATLEEAEAVARQLSVGAVSLNDAALTSSFYEAPKQSFGASGLGPSRMGQDGFMRFFRRKALIAQTGKPALLSAYAEDAN
jgi:acyl-CoA reductase-like NAD-dependent aldehyde dehydrogenase